MSRIGKQPVVLSSGTKVSVGGGVVTIENGSTSLKQAVDPCITVALDDDKRTLTLSTKDASKRSRAMHGLYRSLVANMVEGVEKGFQRKLEIQGVGYSAKMDGKTLVLAIGFNAPVKMPIPEGLTVETPAPTQIMIKGADKQVVGQFAADVRAVRKPEPYKGKGIRYEGEFVRRKVGKSLGA